MKTPIIVTCAVLTSLAFATPGTAWAERERGRHGGSHVRDRYDGARSPQHVGRDAARDHGRHWRGRDGHRDRRWAPERRHVRKHHERRGRHRGHHDGPRHHWRPHRKHHRGHHWRGPRPHRHHYHHPKHSRPWGRGHHARGPVVEKHVYLYTEAYEAGPAEQFELAASVTDPAGISFSFGISRTE
jgi:hypothetical protein